MRRRNGQTRGLSTWYLKNAMDTTLCSGAPPCEVFPALPGRDNVWGNEARVCSGRCLPLGQVIATALLTCAHKVLLAPRYPSQGGGQDVTIGRTPWGSCRHWRNPVENQTLLSDPWGDFSQHRWLWFLSDIKALPEPVEAKGYQRIWNWQVPKGTL